MNLTEYNGHLSLPGFGTGLLDIIHKQIAYKPITNTAAKINSIILFRLRLPDLFERDIENAPQCAAAFRSRCFPALNDSCRIRCSHLVLLEHSPAHIQKLATFVWLRFPSRRCG